MIQFNKDLAQLPECDEEGDKTDVGEGYVLKLDSCLFMWKLQTETIVEAFSLYLES